MHAVSADMTRVTLAQYVIVIAVAALFALFAGRDAALTALLAGLAYAVPTTLLALASRLALRKLGAGSPAALLAGEFIKIFLVIALFALIIKFFDNLCWPAFIVAMIAVMNSYFIVLFKRH